MTTPKASRSIPAPAKVSDPGPQETFRHAKAIGSWGPGSETLAGAGIDRDAVGVVTGAEGDDVWSQVHPLMQQHRAWDRFATA